MKSLKGRILISYSVFGFILIGLLYIGYSFLNRASNIRQLQNDILTINSKTLLLMDADLLLRTEDVLKEGFYRNPVYPKIQFRNRLFYELQKELTQIEVNISQSQLPIEVSTIHEIYIQFQDYENLQQKLISTLKKRGFRDEGLEGLMRTYAHELEKKQSIISLDKLLSLRRHEKDYFLRSDTIYIQKLNKECNDLIASLESDLRKQNEVIQLIKKYRNHFNTIVLLEKEIGNHHNGLIYKTNEKKKAIISNLASASETITSESDKEVKNLINHMVLLVLIGIILTSVIGIFSAHISSDAINRLASSMEQTIYSNFKEEEHTLPKWPTKETVSLSNSYKKLRNTINNQLAALEDKNEQLSVKNTELNKVVTLLIDSENNLKASNELKDKFFSIIAHDLKGPMATNTMMLEFITEKIDNLSKKETKLYAQKVYQASSSILNLLSNLLNWAQSQNKYLVPKSEYITLNDIIENIVNLNAQRIVEKNILLENEIISETIIFADKNMMELVFRNLIDNAIKYTPDNGKIFVKSELIDDFVKVSITDTGVGIKENEKETLFTSLAKEQSSGTNGEKGIGLGLVLTFDFVRKNGGKIEVHSKLNQGSTFNVYLPKSEAVTKTIIT